MSKKTEIPDLISEKRCRQDELIGELKSGQTAPYIWRRDDCRRSGACA